MIKWIFGVPRSLNTCHQLDHQTLLKYFPWSLCLHLRRWTLLEEVTQQSKLAPPWILHHPTQVGPCYCFWLLPFVRSFCIFILQNSSIYLSLFFFFNSLKLLPPGTCFHGHPHLLPRESWSSVKWMGEPYFPLWSPRPPTSVTISLFLSVLMEEVSFILSSSYVSMCAPGHISSWTFSCQQGSLLSPVYSTPLSSNWFHQQLNVCGSFHLNNKPPLTLPNPHSPLLSTLLGRTCLYLLPPFLHLPCALYPTLSGFCPYSLPKPFCLNSVRYPKDNRLRIARFIGHLWVFIIHFFRSIWHCWPLCLERLLSPPWLQWYHILLGLFLFFWPVLICLHCRK